MKVAQSKEISFKGQNIYVGIDVHLKSWSVTVLSENSVLKRFVQAPDPDALYKFLSRNYPGRVTIVCMKPVFAAFGYTRC